MNVEFNASLKDLNTFGIEAKAYALACFSSAGELRELLQSEKLRSLPKMILGGGSNLLFTEDYPGLILKNEVKGIEQVGSDEDYFYVRAGAGENWHSFVMRCIDEGWAGLENLSLIPGNVGASPMQNIGAYGVEVKDRFEELRALDLESLEIVKFNREDCEFGYRESVFKRRYKGRFAIIDVTFKLFRNPRVNTSYGAIESELIEMGITENPGIKEVSEAVVRIRQSKLPNPAELGNAGSFFKNPVVSTEKWEELSKTHPDIPHYPGNDGTVKLAAGWLIEQSGWKGKRIGNCGMHSKQALVLVNYGGATGREIFDHSEKVKLSVLDKFGVDLEREVNII